MRPHYALDFYIADVRDPDGNKLAFVCYHADGPQETVGDAERLPDNA
ncbi:hypothetical protein WJU17_12975 [Iodidimonas sp. SYSU 1G8]